MKDNIKADPELLDIKKNTFEIAVLLDFYGLLLTQRQYEILDLHYNSDLSLGEIADDLGISRQAAHDSIRKGKAILSGYEDRLGLVRRFRTQEDGVKEAIKCLKQIESEIPDISGNKHFIEASEVLKKIMDNL